MDIDMNIFANKDEILKMFKYIIEGDTEPITQCVLKKISQNEIDDELNILLLEMSKSEAYDFIIPLIRHHLELSIDSDESCIKFLEYVKSHLTLEKDIEIIDKILIFIKADENYESDIVTYWELINFENKLPPVCKYRLIECCTYLDSISQDNS